MRGPIIMVFVWSSQPLNIFSKQKMCPPKNLWNWIWKFLYPKKIQFFIWKAMRNWVPTRQYLAFSRPYISDRCPRCNNFETTIHILRDCPWAKEVWCHSLSVLPLTFFELPLQSWLQTNATWDAVILNLQLPWKYTSHFYVGIYS